MLGAVVVLGVIGFGAVAHRAQAGRARRLAAVEAELTVDYRAVDVHQMYLAYQLESLKSSTGTPDVSMFPVVAHGDLFQASFPGPTSVRAVYHVDLGWTGATCVTVVAGGRPTSVQVSTGSCS